MFTARVNKEELASAALLVYKLLQEKSTTSEAAGLVLTRSKSLFKRAINKEIEAPIPNGFFPEEFWEDGELFEYEDLGEAVSDFNLLLMGAASMEAIRKTVHEIEAQAEKDEAELKRNS